MIHILFVGEASAIVFVAPTDVKICLVDKAHSDLYKGFNLLSKYFKRFLVNVNDFVLAVGELADSLKHILIFFMKIIMRFAQVTQLTSQR